MTVHSSQLDSKQCQGLDVKSHDFFPRLSMTKSEHFPQREKLISSQFLNICLWMVAQRKPGCFPLTDWLRGDNKNTVQTQP